MPPLGSYLMWLPSACHGRAISSLPLQGDLLMEVMDVLIRANLVSC